MEWKTYKFSRLFTWSSGKPISAGVGNVPIYGSNGIIGYTNTAKYKDKIILGRVGAYCGSVEYCSTDFNATDNTLITTCNKELIDTKFAYYILKEYGLNKFAGGSAQPLITQTILGHLKCTMPSLPTQRRIASILSSYDNLIEINNRRIKLLEQMAENIYKEWFVRFRFPGYEKCKMVDGLPEGWKVRRLGDFITFQRGVSYGSKDIESGDYILLSMNNIRPWGGFKEDYSRQYCGKFKDFQKVYPFDLIMSITDMTQDRRIIGYTGLIPPGNDNRIICTHLLKLTSCEYDNVFLNGMFNYSGLSRSIAERATGTNVLGLTADILKKVKSYIPSTDLVDKYVQIAKPIQEQIFILQTQNANLARQRDMLLPRLMSGKIELK